LTSRDLWAGLDPPALISWIYEFEKALNDGSRHPAAGQGVTHGPEEPICLRRLLAWQTRGRRQLGLQLSSSVLPLSSGNLPAAGRMLARAMLEL